MAVEDVRDDHSIKSSKIFDKTSVGRLFCDLYYFTMKTEEIQKN